jgi:hypothetical protein
LSKIFSKKTSSVKESSPSPKGSSSKKSLPSSRSGEIQKKKSKKSQVNDDENWLIQATELPTIIK